MDIVAVLGNISTKVTDQIDNPNYGGCAVIASIIGAHLAEAGVPFNIVVDGGWTDNTSINKVRANADTKKFANAHDWNDNGIYFRHLLIEMEVNGKRCLYDTDDGILPYEEAVENNDREIYEGVLTLAEAVKIASVPAGWNSMFDRDQIPQISSIVEDAFKELTSIH